MLRIIMGWILLLITMMQLGVRGCAQMGREEVSFSVGEAASAQVNEGYILYREGEKVEYLPLP